MEKSLSGLFGSGPEADAKTERARDFVKRFSEGPPDQGYTSDEARGQLNELLRHANSDQVERATRKTLNTMPEDQRKEFGQFVDQLQQRGGTARTRSGGTSVDDISRMFGEAGGSASSVDDLFGSLFGGGMGGGTTRTTGGGGFGGMISSLLGSLFGGGRSRSTQTSTGGMGDLGALMGSNVGKMVMGGIAAYLTQELLDGTG